MRFATVICAAGGGSRMGQPKALCRLGSDETFLSSIVSSIQSVGLPSQIIVVVGAESRQIIQSHASLAVTWVENQAWASTHMLDSLLCGLRAIQTSCPCPVLHWPVDCLGVRSVDVRHLLEAPDAPFCALAHHGVPGHPVRISSDTVSWLLEHAHRYQSLRDILAHRSCSYVEAPKEVLTNCNDPNSLSDFIAHKP